MSIITGRGDDGDTDLLFGRRIAKTALRVEALGCVDELNAALGVARASGANPQWIALIDALQEKLIGLMGQLATLPEDETRYLETKFPLIEMSDVEWVTGEAHQYEARGIRFTGWARPGAEGCLARANVDFARSVNPFPKACGCFSTNSPTCCGSSRGWSRIDRRGRYFQNPES